MGVCVDSVLPLPGIYQHGGLDNYINKTRSELLGWEGMRIRVMLQDHKEQKVQKAFEAQFQVPGGDVKRKAFDARKERAGHHKVLMAGFRPFMEDARQAREEAARALGLGSPAT